MPTGTRSKTGLVLAASVALAAAAAVGFAADKKAGPAPAPDGASGPRASDAVDLVEKAGGTTKPGATATTTKSAVKMPKEMDVPEIPVPPSPALPPEEALKTLKVAPGFKVELVAAEPLVEDPVAIAFDGDGRLWVCEMRSYMPHLDPGNKEEEPIGRITCLEDTDGDGRMDKRTIFMDGLVLPRAATPYRDGVLVAAPPYAWFVRDTDGDGKADERQVLATDYTNKSNPEHQPNGLMPAMDNWVHNAQWGGRFRYVGDAAGTGTTGAASAAPAAATGAASAAPAAAPAGQKGPKASEIDPRWVRQNGPGRGQWGISQDDVGRLYINGNSDLLRGDYIPVAWASRNPNFPSSAGTNMKVADDQTVQPIRPTPGINRGYQPQMLDKEGRLTTVTAACGPHVYRGDLLGKDAEGRDVYGNAFIAEPSGNLVKRTILSTKEDGLTVKAVHAYKDAEFLASTDERFRPVYLTTGPDGALYVADLYRGVLQHQRYVTPYLRREIARRDLEPPIHLGRIYRVVPANAPAKAPAKPKMLKAPAAELVQFLSHPNGWWRDMAQQQIVARNDASVVLALQQLATTAGPNAIARLHALYTLEGLRKLDDATLATALADADPRVRFAALRLSEPSISNATSPLIPAVLKLARDPRPEVRVAFLYVASAADTPAARKAVADAYLAETGAEAKAPTPAPAAEEASKAGDEADGDAKAGAAKTAKKPAPGPKVPYARDAVLTGVRGGELEFVQHLVADPAWQADAPGKGALLSGLAQCVVREGKADRVAALLDLIDAQTGPAAWRGSSLLAGVLAQDPKARPAVVKLPAQPALLAKLEKGADAKSKNNAKALAKLLTWPGKAAEGGPKVAPLSAAEQASFDRGKAMFAAVCAACHQPDGLGEVGKAPSMRDSPFLLGPDAVPARIVLNGLRGPVTINGETAELEMPTLAALSDEQIADTLTYARREWGHAGTPITAATVAKVREDVKERGQPWTKTELKPLLGKAGEGVKIPTLGKGNGKAAAEGAGDGGEGTSK